MTSIKSNTIMEVQHNAFGIMQVLMFDKHLNDRPVRDEARDSYVSMSTPGNLLEMSTTMF